MPIPQVPSPLATILATDTYDSNWFSGSTIEQQIQTAINAAVADGAARVLVHEPYDATLVAFSTAVQMVLEGEDWGVYHIEAYGAASTQSAAINSAAIAAAITGAQSVLGAVRANGVTYQTSTTITITAPISFRGRGDSNTVFYRQNLTGPVFELNSPTKGMDFGSLQTLYSSDPGASDTNASGIRLTSFFQSTMTDVQILRSYIGFEVNANGALFFSNTIDNIVVRDVYKTHYKVHVGASGANTGNHWGNIYANGRSYASSTVKDVNGPMFQLSTSDGDTFEQLNLEYANVKSADPRLILIERGAVVFNSLHIEGIQSDAFANLDLIGIFPGSSNKVAVVVNAMQLNAMSLGNITTWTNIVGLQGDNISVMLNGFVEKTGGSTFGGSGLRPAWTNGTRANCSFTMNEWQSSSLVFNTAGLASSTAPIAHIPLYASASLNFAAPGAVPGQSAALTITVTGAALGDLVEVSAGINLPANFNPPIAWVSAANTVSITWFQFAGGAADPDGAGTTYYVKVIKR